MPAAKLQSLLTHCGAQLRLHPRQLKKSTVGRSNGRMVSALTHDSHRVCGSVWRRNEFESVGGHPSDAKLRKFFLVVSLHFFGIKVQLVVLVSAFVMVSTVCPVSCLLFFCSRRTHGVDATVCGYAPGGSGKSLTLTALTRLFGSRLPHTSVYCFKPHPSPQNFLKTHRICISLKTGPGAGWGAVAPICLPHDDANRGVHARKILTQFK